MYDTTYKKEALEITPDGIAAAAATLAIRSEYLEKNHVLLNAFWHFFDLLIDSQSHLRIGLGEEEIARERQQEGRRLWELSEEKLGGLTRRAHYLLHRAYLSGEQLKPIEELTDVDLLAVRGVGLKTLADIRAVIPAPAQGETPPEEVKTVE